MSDARRDPGFGIRDSGLGASNGRRTTPAGLDAAIDGVAREMTDAEPSADLRGNVLEAIERGGRLHAPAFPRWAWAGAAAVLVLAVAMAIWVAGRRHGTPDAPAQSAAIRGLASPAPDRSASAPIGQSAAVVHAAAQPTAAQSVRRRSAPPPIAGDTLAESLGSIPPLTLEPLSHHPPIQIDTISIEAVGISEVTIRPIEIGPLNAGRGVVGELGR